MIKIKKSEDCCGCSACLSICNHNAIVFKEDVEGFKYPMIEEGKCINCGLCEMACPILYSNGYGRYRTEHQYSKADTQRRKADTSRTVLLGIHHRRFARCTKRYGTFHKQSLII